MEHAIIHLWRKPGFADLLRAYKIFIDNEQVGTIRHGERRTFEVHPGSHDVWLTIDWGISPLLSVTLPPGEEVQLICQSKNPLLAFYNITFGATRYMKLYRAS